MPIHMLEPEVVAEKSMKSWTASVNPCISVLEEGIIL